MIQKLINYKDHLLGLCLDSLIKGEDVNCQNYFCQYEECEQLLTLFYEMKLSTNEWYRIREITRGL